MWPSDHGILVSCLDTFEVLESNVFRVSFSKPTTRYGEKQNKIIHHCCFKHLFATAASFHIQRVWETVEKQDLSFEKFRFSPPIRRYCCVTLVLRFRTSGDDHCDRVWFERLNLCCVIKYWEWKKSLVRRSFISPRVVVKCWKYKGREVWITWRRSCIF